MTDARQSMQLRARYRILMELGRGGMGAVHLAMTSGPQGFVKLVVLKMLLPELIGSEAARRMFLEEARVSARIAHPNVIQVHEVVEYDGVPTMVMEYLEGRPLSAVIGDDPSRLPLRMHVYVFGNVLAGLHAAHELRDYDGTAVGLIHRDVSPHNVFLQFDGRVKILDFGIAKATRSEVTTRTGELKGKLRYMAPEQLRGDRDIDRRADVFSVGVMLWEALAGRRMWADLTDADVMLRLLNGQTPPLPAEPRIPPGLAAACLKALHPTAEGRYATAAEFARDLEESAGSLSQGGRADDLSAFLMTLFAEAQESTHRLIDAHIKAAELGAFQATTADAQTTVVGTLREGLRGGQAPPPTKGIAALARVGRLPSAAAGAAAAAAFGTAAWLVFAHGRPEGAPATQPSALSSASGAPKGTPTPRPACEAGFKMCDGQCVSTDRPDVGCGSDDCVPCEVTHAAARCNARHACDIAVCYAGYDNCDNDLSNGCEAETLVDPSNCGACGRKCPPLPHARVGCGAACTIWRCEDGYRDCNGAAADGCEVRSSDDAKNCGHCGTICARGQHCRSGRCGP
jgi:tRNA A-37 threonylcarbamoyl transferase component Bud32